MIKERKRTRTETVLPALLIGTLSMLFAEVFSGASQAWFFNPLSLLLAFPLYMAHTLFFLWIALRLEKTSIRQLYLFGTIFGLYESWITKVLWAGYMDATGPGMGTLFGIAIPEFPVLVFFWHPIMAFIMPVLAYEALTGRAISTHGKILEKGRKKTAAIIVLLAAIGTFIANGNQFNILSVNLSVIGTLLIVLGLYHLSRKKDLKVFGFGRLGFGIVTAYLTLLYVGSFFLLFPGRIPQTPVPYIAILAFYAILAGLIKISGKTGTRLVPLKTGQYSKKDFAKLAAVPILSANLACLIPSMSISILFISYLTLTAIGTAIFAFVAYKTLRQRYF